MIDIPAAGLLKSANSRSREPLRYGVIINGHGHMVPLTAPKAVTAHLLDWLGVGERSLCGSLSLRGGLGSPLG
jgi:hypothetical protein